MELSSASNRQQTLLRKLNRKKYREKERLFLLEGSRAVMQVLHHGEIDVEALFFDESQEYWHLTEWKRVARDLKSRTLSAELFTEVSDTDTPQGVLALCRIPEEATTGELAAQQKVVIAVDGIQDPGNMGTIIRTASWFGAGGLLSGKGTVDLFHPKVVRSTAGATGTVPHLNGDLKELLPEFESAGWKVYLLDAGAGSKPLTEIAITEKSLLVVGNEAHGIQSELEGAERTKVRIPSGSTRPEVESLNAAIATSIALYTFSTEAGRM